jgi:flagellar biogenesis protein FliO
MQFYKKTSSRKSLIGVTIKLTLILLFILGIVFFLNKIEFPAPKKDIQKVIPNEKFKIVK